MKIQRLLWTAGLCLSRGAKARADFARKQGIFGNIGENVIFQPRVVPLYSQLIRIHNNVIIAKAVDFVTHDMIHLVLNRVDPVQKAEMPKSVLHERMGCIEIMDNVFIGSHSIIMYDTKIGPNVIIASGSVVTKDCEPNSVYAGVPARKIGTFEDYCRKRSEQESDGLISVTSHNQQISESEIKEAWNLFEIKHR